MANVQLSGVVPTGSAQAAGLGGPTAPVAVPVAAPPASVSVPMKAAMASAADQPGSGTASGQTDGAYGGSGQPKAAKLDDLELKNAVKNANQALAAISTQLVFVFDDQTHQFAVKLLDIQTQKVVQQIPAAAMHATATALSGPLASGALVDTKA